jgi:dTDP-4-amino-4,6-dideoxygalactose transaminase
VNSRLDTIQAAILNVKLSRLDAWHTGRQTHAQRYATELGNLQLDGQLGIPTVANGSTSVWNQYTVRVPEGRRGELQQHFAAQKIGSAVYYPIPLHRQKCFADLGYEQGSLPVTEQAAEEVLSLPIFAELTHDEQSQVIRSLAEFFGVEAASKHRAA